MIIPKKPLNNQRLTQKHTYIIPKKGAIMDSVMQQFSDWLKGIIKETLNKLLEIERDDGFPELMDMKTTYKFLGISYDTFQIYRNYDGFPKELPAKRWSKRAIKKWLENQI
jgi:hypothetical protein